ncbi:DNA-binding anti-repressor SinI [Mesobacillus foraminis]|nr:DNA-binding anti-repressor SinI [Mesobacillus foraminis]MBT2759619.1 DNA-binding anti-repressor SinI [Mesobacillus foraminis]
MKEESKLAEEWIELVRLAIRSNVSKEEFRKFLEEKSQEKDE